jgi:VWFA-related protein
MTRLPLLLLLLLGPGDEPVRERVRVDVIRVPVFARDRTGRQITDLAKAELTLRVDGRTVPIDTVEFPEPILPSALPVDTAPAASIDRVTPASESLPVETFVLIDESTSGGPELRDALDEIVRFLGTSPTSRRVAVGVFRRSQLRMLTEWTDIAAARKALTELRRHPYVEMDPSFVVHSQLDLMELELLRHCLLEAVLQAVSAFPDHPARRGLLFVTSGRTFADPVPIRAMSERDRGTPESGRDAHETSLGQEERRRDDFELWTRAAGNMREYLVNDDFIQSAVERDIAVFLVNSFRAETLADVGRKTLADSAPRPVLSTQLEANSRLLEIGRDTGGGLVARPRGAAEGLARLEDRVEGSITFGDPFRGDHAYHGVEIVCRRPGVVLDFRRGYRIPTEDERILGAVLARFHGDRAGAPMALAASAAPARTAQGAPGTRLHLAIAPPHGSADTADRAIDVIAVGRTKDGGSTAPVRWSGTASRASDSEAWESDVVLKVPPAGYTWSVAVRDSATGLVDHALVEPAR